MKGLDEMIPEQKIEIKWNPNNREWYESKGYIFSKYRQGFLVNPYDLTLKSNKKIQIICDYCGAETKRSYCDYTDSQNSVVKKDACKNCKHLKSNEVIKVTYGVDHQSQLSSVIKKISDAEKLDYDFVKNHFSISGYTLVSGTYVNAKSPLIYTCNIHHDKGNQAITYDNFKQRASCCRYCNSEIRKKKLINEYKNIVEEKGYIFVNLNIENGKAVLDIKCNKHLDRGIQTILASNFKKYTGCKYCGKQKMADQKRNSVEKVISQFKIRDYTLLNPSEYLNNSTELLYICNKHKSDGIQTTCFANIKNGVTCRKCNYARISGDSHYLWKGGISPLHNYMRDKINQWKRESLEKFNFCCAVTGEKSSKLVVHHTYSYNKILIETLTELELPIYETINLYSATELNKIEKLLIKKHYYYGLGVPLLPSIHDEFHRIYGRGNNTPLQFDEFKEKYLNTIEKYDGEGKKYA